MLCVWYVCGVCLCLIVCAGVAYVVYVCSVSGVCGLYVGFVLSVVYVLCV